MGQVVTFAQLPADKIADGVDCAPIKSAQGDATEFVRTLWEALEWHRAGARPPTSSRRTGAVHRRYVDEHCFPSRVRKVQGGQEFSIAHGGP